MNKHIWQFFLIRVSLSVEAGLSRWRERGMQLRLTTTACDHDPIELVITFASNVCLMLSIVSKVQLVKAVERWSLCG